MKGRISAVVIILLAVFVIQTAARIEVLNAQAGNYLPRQDRNPDGTLAGGKWRKSLDNTPRDQLRDVVETAGLRQYWLAPVLLVLAMAVYVKSTKRWTRTSGAVCGSVAMIAMWLMLYREYYQSLGW